MNESPSKITDQLKIKNGELQFRESQAYGFYNGVHLVILPASYGSPGFHVYFTEDNSGKPDFSKVKNSMAIDGNPNDLQEIADMFMRRLTSGVLIEAIFKDFEEQNRRAMEEAYLKFKEK